MSKKKINLIILVILCLITFFIVGYFNKKDNNEIDASRLNEGEKHLLGEAAKVVNNKITINLDSEEIIFKYDNNFKDFNNELRSAQRLLYSFDFLNYLGNAYELTGDEEYVRHGMELISDFSEQAPFDPSDMTWHDETTARRLSNFVKFYNKTEDALSRKNKKEIQNSTKFIADKVAYTDFYSGSNNHGFYQDKAIISYAQTFDDGDVIKIGSRRLEEYFLSHFGSDGVHLENSPEYHFILVAALRDALNDYSREMLPRYSELEDLYEKSVNYSKMIVLPSGITPNVGDSKNMEIVLKDYYDKKLLDSASNLGRQTFMDSGYDIYKTEDSYLLFRGGYQKNYHHHNDDLSFWLYKDGNIFTEFGSFGYEYSNPHADYQKSFEAHNTLIVDGENIAETKEVFLLNSKKENMMSGETKRITGVNFQRNIQFNEDLTEINIDNKIKSLDGESHSYELLFHLDPSIDIEVVKKNEMNSVKLFRDNINIGEFNTLENIEIKDDYYYPYYYATPEKTKVISVQSIGKDKNIQAEINFFE